MKRRFDPRLDDLNVLVVALGPEEDVLFVNRAAGEFLGAPPEEIAGSNWFDRFVPDHARERQRRVFRRLAEGKIDPAGYSEYNVLNAAGAPRLIGWHSSQLHLGDGAFSGTLMAGVDITERRWTEDKLEQLSQAVQQSPSIVVITDTAGHIEFVNKRFEDVTGYSLEEVRGHNPRFLKSGRTPPDEYRKLWETITAGGTWNGELLNRKKNGEVYWGDSRIAPIRDRMGAITHYVELMEDVTERKRLERAVVSVSEEERRAIGQELHDVLGQQLTGITLLAKALERKLAGEGHAAHVEAAGLGELAGKALEEVRTLSRGLYPVEVQVQGLARALEELALSQQRLFGVPVIFQGTEPEPGIDPAAPINLYRIAQEAVNNAIKHAQADCITIRLEREGETLVLEVADDGRGLGTAGGRSGGMGLRIMRYRASMIGGSLEYLPNEPSGTRVRCVIHAQAVDPNGERSPEGGESE